MNRYEKILDTSEFVDMFMTTSVVNDAIQKFSQGGWIWGDQYPSRWKELEPFLSESKKRYHSAVFKDVKVNAGTLAGRVLITFERGDFQITIIGGEGEPERDCGLQSIHASVDQAIYMIETVIKNWKIEAFQPNENAMIV
jgi:hypothetical protein